MLENGESQKFGSYDGRDDIVRSNLIGMTQQTLGTALAFQSKYDPDRYLPH